MKGLIAAVTVLVLAACGIGWASTPQTTGAMGYQYVSPIPGSRSVSPGNNIAIRQGRAIDPLSVDATLLSVVGSTSGAHAGRLRLSDDGRTIVFEPFIPYTRGESVSVTLRMGTRTVGGAKLPSLAFGFTIASCDARSVSPPALPPSVPVSPSAPGKSVGMGSGEMPAASASVLLSGVPTITVTASDNPDPGDIFITPRSNTTSAPLLITDNLGMPLFFRQKATDYVDFKKQNNLLTYFDLARSKSYALDSLYAVVDSFAAGNGYSADPHDMQLLPDGHALLIIFDPQPVGMDTVVAGGDPDAIVLGLVVQEIDQAKSVVFQWRSWDHFRIQDAIGVDLTASLIDPVHGNAVERDTDGNLMISSKYLNEVTKINRQTGEIMWRWGRNARNNDFTFVGDTRGFSHQHDIRRAPNGHVTLFDNGNGLSPEYSRALEYNLDEQNKTATLVAQYLPDGGGFSPSNGSLQRRTSGGAMISWGSGTIDPDVTDLHPDGTKALQFGFIPQSLTSYRAYRFDWRGALIATDVDSLGYSGTAHGDTVSKTLQITNNGSADLAITSFVSTDSASYSVAAALPITVHHGESVPVQVRFHPQTVGGISATLYVRSARSNELIACAVHLSGVGVGVLGTPPDRVLPGLSLAQSRPNPARGELVIPFSIARMENVSLRVYDLSGRLAATLLDGPLAAGEHVARWDGSRRGGAKASPGPYFYELRASGERLQRRLVLLR